MNHLHDPTKTETPAVPGLNSTLHELFRPADDAEKLRNQVEALRTVVLGLAQDVAALKQMLSEKGGMTSVEFASALQSQMLRDHSSAGASPWTGHTYYAYTVTESERIRQEYPAVSQETLARYQEEARDAEILS